MTKASRGSLLLANIALLGLTAVVLLGCGGGEDTATVEPEITEAVQSDLDGTSKDIAELQAANPALGPTVEGVEFDAESVDCPDEYEEGQAFECDVVASDASGFIPGELTGVAQVTVDGETVEVETELDTEQVAP